MNEVGKRIEWIDNCKAVAILLVSFAHILGGFPRDTLVNVLLLLCYSIELPIFFLLSGIQKRLFSKNISFGEFASKRVVRILWPYFTMSTIYIGIDLLHCYLRFIVKGNLSFASTVNQLCDTITLWGSGALWFLPTLFVAELVSFWLCKMLSTSDMDVHYGGAFVSTALALTGICCGIEQEKLYELFLSRQAMLSDYVVCFMARSLVAVSFIMLGYVIEPMIMKGINVKQRYKYILGGLGLLIGGGLAILNDRPVDLHFGFVRNPFITYVSAIILFMSIVWLVSNFRNKVFSYVGRNTLLLLGLQIGTAYIIMLIKLLGVVSGCSLYILLLGAWGVFMVISILLCKIINKKWSWIYKIKFSNVK